MAYVRSAAFKEFSDKVDELKRVVRAADRLRIGGRRNQTYREAMLSSAVLLGFAYFESYVSDVTDNVCNALCAPGNAASSLPNDMRTHIAIAANLITWGEIKDPVKQRKQLLAYKNIGGFELLDDTFVPTKLDVSALLSGISYPKPDNIKKLLKRLGIDDPVDRLRKRGGHSIEQNLVSIHDARAELAHTGRLPSWTVTDYTDRLNGLKEYGKTLDKVLCSYVTSIVPLLNWKK